MTRNHTHSQARIHKGKNHISTIAAHKHHHKHNKIIIFTTIIYMATIGKRTSVYTYSVRQSKSRYSFVDSVLRQKLSTLLRLARPCHITPVLTPPSPPSTFCIPTHRLILMSALHPCLLTLPSSVPSQQNSTALALDPHWPVSTLDNSIQHPSHRASHPLSLSLTTKRWYHTDKSPIQDSHWTAHTFLEQPPDRIHNILAHSLP